MLCYVFHLSSESLVVASCNAASSSSIPSIIYRRQAVAQAAQNVHGSVTVGTDSVFRDS